MVPPGASAAPPPPPLETTEQPESEQPPPARWRPWYLRTWKRALAALVISAVVGSAAGLADTWLGGEGSGRSPVAGNVGPGASSTAEYPPEDRGAPLEVSGTTLDGDPISTTDLRGRAVVLNVWGSWCAPCREEAATLADVSQAYADKGVSFLGINIRDNQAAAKAFEDRYGIEYPSIFDTDGRPLLPLNDYVPVNAVPVTVILDTEGRVAARVIGVVEKSTLTALLDQLVSESGSAADGGNADG